MSRDAMPPPGVQLLIVVACFGLWMVTLVMTFRLEVSLREHAVQMRELARANDRLAWKIDPQGYDEEMRQLERPPREMDL
jgi:hypothetical protein